MIRAAVDLVPSAQQALLLQAALLPGVAAVAAWRDWQRGAPVEALEPDSQWLLPQLYANLRQAGVATAVTAAPLRRYANVYRHNWYKNQLLLRAAQPLLGDANVLLLGGAALAIGHYPLLGARPIEALSLLSPQPASLAQRLAAAGWQPVIDPLSHLAYVDCVGRRIALYDELLDARRDHELLSHAQTLPFGQASVRVLNTLDQFILVLAQRDHWDSRSRLLWVADAAQILRRGRAGSLETILHRARVLALEPVVVAGWRLLSEVYGLGSLAAA